MVGRSGIRSPASDLRHHDWLPCKKTPIYAAWVSATSPAGDEVGLATEEIRGGPKWGNRGHDGPVLLHGDHRPLRPEKRATVALAALVLAVG